MSLKTRLRISIVALVMAVALVLSALNLHSLAEARFADVLERAEMTAMQVQSFLNQRIRDRVAARVPQPVDLDEMKGLWREIVRQDREISMMLEDTMASSRVILEISITGEDGNVLASSNPARVGMRARALPGFAAWKQKRIWDRLVEVASRWQDYEVALPLGIAEQKKPIFTIQVIVSSVLLRNTVLPQIRYLAAISLLSLAASMMLGVLVSNLAFRPLARISQTIDRISSGELARETPPLEYESKEFATVRSKLNLLGQQFRGAKEDVTHLRTNIEQLLERLEEAVLLFDKNERLVMAGRAAERFLGRGRWEMMGRALEELLPPSSGLGAAVHGAVQFRRPLRDHSVILERDGEPPARLLVNVELLEDFPSRDRIGTLVTLRDAETRSQLESQLDISTRLAAISRLTGGVAHEIKNPLNAIALHLEILKSKLAAGAAEEAAAEIDIISREITRLDRVVKAFLDFTRPVDVQFRDLELAGLARDVAALVSPQAQLRRVTVSLDASPEEVFMRGDPDLLKQAILNVVVNGVEAMKNGGQLSIRVRQPGDECLLSITDQGVGIPPELQDKIFNLYFSTKGKGSGIGLAITFRVVQLHNGTIDFTSEPGKGTTFRMRFPAVEKALSPGSGSGKSGYGMNA